MLRFGFANLVLHGGSGFAGWWLGWWVVVVLAKHTRDDA